MGVVPRVTLNEILYVASLLVQRVNCPVDVVNAVLQYAGFVLSFQVETNEIRNGRSDMNDMYLTLTLPRVNELSVPRGVSIGNCVSLIADCSSHDQGWASFDAACNGSYRNSYTWSEVVVIKENEESNDPCDVIEAARATVSTNVRARNTFRHHRKCFSDPAGVVSHIALGDTVQLVLRSKYPGWANFANYGKLSVCFPVEISEDVSFDGVECPSAPPTPSNPLSCSLQ